MWMEEENKLNIMINYKENWMMYVWTIMLYKHDVHTGDDREGKT